MNPLEVKNRKDLKNLIIYIENNFKVNSWKIDDIHLWPILRIRLYMMVMMEIENPTHLKITATPEPAKQKVKAARKRNLATKIVERLKLEYQRLSLKYQKQKDKRKLANWLKKLPKVDHLFFAQTTYRVTHKNKLFNRFFDTYIKQKNIGSNYMYLESKKDPNGDYLNKDQICFFEKFKKIYHHTTSIKNLEEHAEISLEGYKEFDLFIQQFDYAKPFYKIFNKEDVLKILAYIKKDLDFFNLILDQCKPTHVYSLCYYGGDVMCLMAEANRKGVKTIDYQHGPQTDVHMAYTSWSQLPEDGYHMLPRNFWCWDPHSTEIVNQWANQHALYQAEEVGNFWIDYWKKKAKTFNENGFILYSLQPSPVKLSELFTEEILQFIKHQDYTWYLRLHPRQLEQKEDIIKLLESAGVYDLVEIDEATNTPLPLLLSQCQIHLTQYSGCAIEANLMGKNTVFLNTIGKEAFPYMFKERKAYYIDPESVDFNKKLTELLKV